MLEELGWGSGYGLEEFSRGSKEMLKSPHLMMEPCFVDFFAKVLQKADLVGVGSIHVDNSIGRVIQKAY